MPTVSIITGSSSKVTADTVNNMVLAMGSSTVSNMVANKDNSSSQHKDKPPGTISSSNRMDKTKVKLTVNSKLSTAGKLLRNKHKPVMVVKIKHSKAVIMDKVRVNKMPTHKVHTGRIRRSNHIKANSRVVIIISKEGMDSKEVIIKTRDKVETETLVNLRKAVMDKVNKTNGLVMQAATIAVPTDTEEIKITEIRILVGVMVTIVMVVTAMEAPEAVTEADMIAVVAVTTVEEVEVAVEVTLADVEVDSIVMTTMKTNTAVDVAVWAEVECPVEE